VVIEKKILFGAAMNCNVRNANYERVVTVMDKLLKERHSDMSGCQRCVDDIAAIALNYLPPHYYVDVEEEKEIGSPWVMVETAVVEAIDRVLEKPSHHHESKANDKHTP
jgi:Late competence development protein ComFB